jgi:hypothetical protein
MQRLFRLDDCPWHEAKPTELTPFPVPSWLVDAIARMWLGRYPDDNLWVA